MPTTPGRDPSSIDGIGALYSAGQLTRRDALKRLGLLGLAIPSAGAFLAACSSAVSSAAPTAAASASAAATAAATASAAASGGLKIGFSIWGLDIPFAVPLAKGVQDTAASMGVDLVFRAASWDASVQAQHLQEFVTQKVNVIGATPVDVKAIAPAAQQAKTAGVPVVGCLGTIEGFPYLGADDVEYGRQMGNLIVQALSDVPAPHTVAFLRGALGGSPDSLRYQGIMEILSGHSEIKVVAEAHTDWSVDKGLSQTQDFLQRFPKGQLSLIHGWGGGVEVPGAKFAHTQAGREDVRFTGGELTTQTKDAIANGWEYGIIIQDPYSVGVMVVQALSAMKPTFDKVPSWAVVPLPICTKANLDKFTAF